MTRSSAQPHTQTGAGSTGAGAADSDAVDLSELLERAQMLTQRRQALQARGDKAGVATLEQALRRLTEQLRAIHPRR